MVQSPDLLDGFELGGVSSGELKLEPGSEMDCVFGDDVERTSDGAVRFGADARGDDGSIRFVFRTGLFTVGVDAGRQPSATSSACLRAS